MTAPLTDALTASYTVSFIRTLSFAEHSIKVFALIFIFNDSPSSVVISCLRIKFCRKSVFVPIN